MSKQGRITSAGWRKLDDALEYKMRQVKHLAKFKAPVGSGELMGDIDLQKTDYGWIVGTEKDYGKYLEFGTRKMRAQPFLRPAAKQAFQEDP